MKKILLLPDVENWAFDRIAKQLKKNIGNEFDISIDYAKDYPNPWELFLAYPEINHFHIFWRAYLNLFYEKCQLEQLKIYGFTEEGFKKKYLIGKSFTTTIYDHLLLKNEFNITQRLFSHNTLVTDYSTSSKILFDLYSNELPIQKRPDAYTPDGVDLDIFKPTTSLVDKYKSLNKREVIVGWAGNSNWDNDLKGLHTIIVPAVEALKKSGYSIKLLTSDRVENKPLPFDRMPDFYNSIDCYLCGSSSEGTPNPVLEAMACGIPVISTNVGIVPEVFGNKQKDFISPRTVEDFTYKLKELIDSPRLFSVLSDENLQSIKKWDWKFMTNNFREFFNKSHKLI